MNTKIVKKHVDHTFGFPVVFLDAPMRKTVGGWVLDVNPNIIETVLLKALAHKPVPLSGNEVRFIRLHFNMTLQNFGKRFDVSHVAVLKWESSGDKPTKMNWATEKDLRLFVLSNFPNAEREVSRTYQELEEKPETPAKYKPIEVPMAALAG